MGGLPHAKTRAKKAVGTRCSLGTFCVDRKPGKIMSDFERADWPVFLRKSLLSACVSPAFNWPVSSAISEHTLLRRVAYLYLYLRSVPLIR